jgi:Ca-activated chloride channel family protein
MRRLTTPAASLLLSVGLLALCALIYLPPWLVSDSGLRFENPWMLLGFLIVPFVIVAGVLEKRRTGRLRYSLTSVLVKMGPNWRTRLLPLSVAFQAAAVAFLVVALARPQDSTQQEESQTEGIDIVMVLDVSLSMKASDLEPTRLDAAKAVVQDFIKRRKNDRIGVVIFAENAYTLCPLTLDYSILANMISDVQLGMIEGRATAIGNAVGVALSRLRKSDAKSKVVILLTDGTSNAGNITPDQASVFAKTLGMKIYTVLMGRQDDAPVSSGRDFLNRAVFGKQNVPINRELLVKMSENTGGAFFEATHRKGLISSFHAILNKLERSRIADQGVVYAEIFGRYLWPALLLIALDLILGLVLLRRMP